MHKIVRLTKVINKFCEFNLKNNLANVSSSLCFQNRNYTNKNSTLELPGISPDIDIVELTKNDSELLKKLQLIILEVDVSRQEGQKVPESNFIKENQWRELLAKPSRSQRKKYLEFLWKLEKKKENQRNKREEARIERENRPEYEGDGHIRYGLNHNTFLLRIYDTTINNLYNSKLISAYQFGQPLVIDCGYDFSMTTRECYNCAKQIMLAFSDNRMHDEPFDLHLCNAKSNSPTMQALQRHITTLHEPWFPLSVHQESYSTAKMPSIDQNHSKRNIVYLTPHCREEMSEFDHDTVYIIGGIVDKMNQEPLSLAKAKKEGLKMQKLPLDRYLSWGSGSGKSLTINQMVLILLDLRRTGDWGYALRHVPRRKVLGDNIISKTAENSALRYDKRRSFDNFRHSSNTKELIKELMKS